METARGTLDRKTIEKNRRIRMKGLIFKLTSLVPQQHFKPSKDMLSQHDQIDQVAAYIKKLSEKVEKLKKRRNLAMITSGTDQRNVHNPTMQPLKFPIVEVRDVGSSLKVAIISGTKKGFALFEVIRLLEDEGTEVLSTTISTVGHNIYHILHAQAKVSRFGVDALMIYDRLQALVSKCTSKHSPRDNVADLYTVTPFVPE